MYYNEYLYCAKKHLNGCNSLFRSYSPGSVHDSHVWMELYYLSGYIIEGITVYAAYKLYNWPVNDDIITVCNPSFTQQTKLDFWCDRKVNGSSAFPSRAQDSTALSVQRHRFQNIVKCLLKSNPATNSVPYIGNGTIDQDVESLIDSWKPDIRYKYVGRNNPLSFLNEDIIRRLLDTCKTICINTQTNI